jgi:hypothetical protein
MWLTATGLFALLFSGPAIDAIFAQSNPFLSSQPGYPNWSAFTGVKWRDDRPLVEIDNQWYELLQFHGIPVGQIREACEDNRWPYRHRFTEDLVQVVRLMGHKIDKTTDLVLRDLSGETVTLKNVTMTEANRRRTIRSSVRNATLSREDALQDLRIFQETLESQFSYLQANNVDYKTAIKAIVDRLEEETNRDWLARELQLVMAQFIDGHARVSGAMSMFATGFLPFLIVPSGDRHVAIRPDRSEFLDDEFPYLKAMDGVDLCEWLKVTEKYIAKGSPQYRRRHGLRHIRAIQQCRGEMGLEQKAALDVEIVSRDGQASKSSTLMVSESFPLYGEWPPVRQPGILTGNIGYLRLELMNGDAVRLLQKWLPRFRATDGLIVDVRGNGGGMRTPIFELAGYLLSKDDAPRIGNVAKYRLAEKFGEDHLSAARFVYRERSPRFTERERAAIQAFKRTFQPEWTPPEDQFSQWHYLVLSKDSDDPRFEYQQPVAILLDEYCFSATDIFLGAFKGWPEVTLIGQPSGGGSARVQVVRLPNSGILVRCASMASFQRDGRLYDTHGVQPDICVVRPPEYYLQNGDDVILETALRMLQKGPPED